MRREISVGDIVDQQTDMLLRYDSVDFRQVFTSTLAQSLTQIGGHVTAKNLCESACNTVASATPYRVRAEVMPLLYAMASSYHDDDDDRVLGEPPTPCGFVRFEEPLTVIDTHGKQMLTHVLVWGPLVTYAQNDSSTRPGTICVLWNDLDTEPDFYAHEMLSTYGDHTIRALIGRWSVLGATALVSGMKIGGHTLETRVNDGERSSFTNTFRLINALFDLFNQRVVTPSDDVVQRSFRRRAERAGLRVPKFVRTVTLRRKTRDTVCTEPTDTDEVRWSCRWVVDGH